MTLRDRKQKELADLWLKSGKFGIILACPRFGKIRTSIHALNEIKPKSILICYPDKKIEQSWKNDFEELNFDDSIVTYTTHLSIKKHVDKKFDVVIIDEIHLLSENQIETCNDLFDNNKVVLGLTGTLSLETKENLLFSLGINVIANYPIEKAIEEGVIVNVYETCKNAICTIIPRQILCYKGTFC